MVPREGQLAGLDQPFLHVRVAAMPVPVALFTLWSWGLAMALDAVQMQRSIDSLWLRGLASTAPPHACGSVSRFDAIVTRGVVAGRTHAAPSRLQLWVFPG